MDHIKLLNEKFGFGLSGHRDLTGMTICVAFNNHYKTWIWSYHNQHDAFFSKTNSLVYFFDCLPNGVQEIKVEVKNFGEPILEKTRVEQFKDDLLKMNLSPILYESEAEIVSSNEKFLVGIGQIGTARPDDFIVKKNLEDFEKIKGQFYTYEFGKGFTKMKVQLVPDVADTSEAPNLLGC